MQVLVLGQVERALWVGAAFEDGLRAFPAYVPVLERAGGSFFHAANAILLSQRQHAQELRNSCCRCCRWPSSRDSTQRMTPSTPFSTLAFSFGGRARVGASATP
jgi:hypothetical protein